MESKTKFVQNKTIFLSFTSPNTTSDINIPFAVDKIIFKLLGSNGTTNEYGVLSSDLIQWESIGVVYRNVAIPYSSAQIEYHFQTPTKIQGIYSFTLKNLDKDLATIGGTENIVFIAEFVRSSDKSHA